MITILLAATNGVALASNGTRDKWSFWTMAVTAIPGIIAAIGTVLVQVKTARKVDEGSKKMDALKTEVNGKVQQLLDAKDQLAETKGAERELKGRQEARADERNHTDKIIEKLAAAPVVIPVIAPTAPQPPQPNKDENQ